MDAALIIFGNFFYNILYYKNSYQKLKLSGKIAKSK
jgi:hypothetical protein